MVKRSAVFILIFFSAYGWMCCSAGPSDQVGSDKSCVGCDSTAQSPRSGMVSTERDISGSSGVIDTSDMVYIPGQLFRMGASDNKGRADEYPSHWVRVNPFRIAKHEVTNAEFRAFVEATGYVTIAERDVDWEQLKTQVPPGTPKPADSLLAAGFLVFDPHDHEVDLNDYT
ncbi:MAG: SUMF1/EgtB/PvdO family nonheme iron enzyme [Flavobacteriales bacterium]|nr:SUMF1/EgtB/PvdO family nonheme iron enzyme [Flavobacteriales bacterium]